MQLVSRYAVLSVVVMVSVILSRPTYGDFLLSDNRVSEGVVPLATPRINTGATYAWVTSVTGNSRGNTDPSIVSGDEVNNGYTDMQDNVAETGGGNYATYGTWQGSVAVATAQFDLQTSYNITRVILSNRFNGSSNGVGRFEVWVSDSPQNESFTLWTTWTAANPTDDRDARIELTAAPVEARYVQLFVSRFSDGQANHSNHSQLQLGEMVIFGETVPEPHTAAAALGLLACAATVRRRH